MEDKSIQELELIILSSMISRMSVYMMLSQYPSELFDTPALGVWFDAVRDCYSTNGTCDMMSVMGVMRDEGNIGLFNDWMDKVATAPVSMTTIEQHIKTLVGAYKKRELDRAARRAIESHNAEDAMEILSEGMEAAALGCLEVGTDITEIAAEELDDIFSDREMIATGFNPLDRAIRGVGKGELVVIGGHSKHGKTTLALQLGIDMSAEGRGNFYSLEMTRSEVFKKILSRKAAVTIDDMTFSKMDDAKRGRVNAARESLKSGRYKFKIIDDLFSVDEIISHAKLAWMKEDLKFIIVDYLQICDSHKSKEQNRYLVVGEITRKLKRFAQQTGVPVIALAQMNGDEDERPGGKNFRESKNIFQDCNVPLIVWYDKKNNRYLIIVERSRRTAPAEIEVVFEGQYHRFRDATPAVKNWQETERPS